MKPPTFGLLGKPPGHQDVTREEVLRRLALVEARLTVLENKSLEDELQRGQHHRALCEMQAALSVSLTEGTVKMTEQDRKAWNGENASKTVPR